VKLYDDADRAFTIISWGLIFATIFYFGLHVVAHIITTV